MASTIRVKRRAAGSPTGAPASLRNAEPAFHEGDNILYIGVGTGGAGGTATAVEAIAGRGAFMALSGDQSASGVKTFSSSPMVPVPTTNGQAANKQYVDSALSSGGFGNMLKSTYDPQNINGDAFDRSKHTGAQAISTVTGLQAALDGKAADRAAMSQAEAEAGTGTAIRDVTPQRIAQAIDARAFTGTESIKTAAYTIVKGDQGDLVVINVATPVTISLTAAATLGAGFIVAVKNIGAGTVTLDPNGTETIDGATTYALITNESVFLECSGAGFRKIASYRVDGSDLTGLTKAQVGLGNVSNTSDADKPVSTATASALSGKLDNSHAGSGGTAHANATTTVAGFMSGADKTKLDGIASGATANATDAALRDRASHTGSQAISTITSLQTTLDGKEASQTAMTQAEAEAGTGTAIRSATPQRLRQSVEAAAFHGRENAKTAAYTVVKADQGQVLTFSSATAVVASLTASATLGTGFVVSIKNIGAGVVTIDPNASETIDGAATFALIQNEAVLLQTNGTTWRKLAQNRVDGSDLTGLTKAQVGLSNVDNTADTAKPVSTAQQTALNAKANSASPTFTGTVTVPTPTAGDSTTKAASTAFVGGAITTAVAGKADSASPTFTGTPTAPTAALGTNTQQLATTAFVGAALGALIGAAPGALDTLNELAAALGNDPNFAATITNALADKQPLNPVLTALSGISPAADRVIYFTGAATAAVMAVTAAARSLLDDASTTAMRTTLGLGTLATQDANDVSITGGTIDGIEIDGGTF